MTERKPPQISFVSWIDQQINEAAERGAFDNLPGAGKPLPKGETGGDAWLRNYLAREGVAAEELLPTPLRLRKERERLAERVSELRTEAEVREVVRDLNRRIMAWRRSRRARPSSCRWSGKRRWSAAGGKRNPPQPPRPRRRP